MAFGFEIKRLRSKSNISAQKLADLIGIDADRLRKWEEKDFDPRDEDTVKIEQFFGMSLRDIVNLESIKEFTKVPNQNQTNGTNRNVDIKDSDILTLQKKLESSYEARILELKTANEKYLQEKEARRKETEARLLIAEKEKERLLDLLGVSLNKVEGYASNTLAQLEAHIHHEAFREADGDSKAQKRILEEVNKKAGDLRKSIVAAGNLKAGNK